MFGHVESKLFIKIKKLSDDAIIPSYANKGDAGFDLISTETITICAGETKLIPTGLAFAIPDGFEMQVRPRSGMSFKTKFRVSNSPGTIDSGYRGEVKIIGENIGTSPIFINKGDRIAQGVICPVYEADFHIVDDLNSTDRGIGGFGSSGSN
jgi:dUTP pyrophosphatase